LSRNLIELSRPSIRLASIEFGGGYPKAEVNLNALPPPIAINTKG